MTAKIIELGIPPKKPRVADFGRGNVMGCPSRGSLKYGFVAMKFRNCTPTKLSIIVEIMGLMLYFAVKDPAIKPKKPPAKMPTIIRRGIIIYAGKVMPDFEIVRPTTVTIVAPNSICPQPPMLKNFILKGKVKANVVKIRGIVFLIVSWKPKLVRNDEVKSVLKTLKTLKPKRRTTIAIIPSARRTETR